MAEHHTPHRAELILSSEIKERVPYSANHLRRLEADGQFPRRVRIGANRIAWIRDEIEAWLNQRIAERQVD